MKIFAISDIHGEKKYIDSASEMIRDADMIAISGDISKSGDRDNAEDILSSIEKYNRNIIAVHGNWDRNDVLNLLEEKGISIHSRGRTLDNIGFFGVGGSNPTPMKTATEYNEEEIYEFLRSGYSQIKGSQKVVLLSHTPPRKIRDRTFLGLRGGSKSVRKFLEENSVDLCLVGHIHEASGIEHLDSCIVANSGSFKKGRYSMVYLEDSINIYQGKIKIKRRCIS